MRAAVAAAPVQLVAGGIAGLAVYLPVVAPMRRLVRAALPRGPVTAGDP